MVISAGTDRRTFVCHLLEEKWKKGKASEIFFAPSAGSDFQRLTIQNGKAKIVSETY